MDKENQIISVTKDLGVSPSLDTCDENRNSTSPCLSSRMKRRIQVHKSLEFSLTKCYMTSKVIKASHSIITPVFQSPPVVRKNIPGRGVILNNRKVSGNIFLDAFPL
jgi:hypothetical protein